MTAAAPSPTNRRHNVVALVGAGAFHSPAPIERLRYSAYGVPTWEVPGGLNGDGQTDAADIAHIEPALDTALGDPNYSAAADLNFDGVVDAVDLAALLSWVGQADHRTALWGGHPTSAAATTAACSVGYAGALYDRATGLWLMRHRWFDPELGRWTTRDPAGYVDGSSLYMYVRGNPLAYWDPFGLEAVTTGEVLREMPKAIVQEAWDQVVMEPARAILDGNVREILIQAASFTPFGRIARSGSRAIKAVDNAGDASRSTNRMADNAASGRAREAQVKKELQEEHPNASVQSERLLRNADGSKAVDDVTGEGRRVDHVVVEDGRVTRVVETTSETADKTQQLNKENRIREAGGTFVRDKDTKELLPIEDVPTETVRRP